MSEMSISLLHDDGLQVMPKLKLHLNSYLIEELSKANPRAVEKLLVEIKEKVDSALCEDSKENEESEIFGPELSGISTRIISSN